MKAPKEEPTQIVIDDGKPHKKLLQALKKDIEWLKKSLKEQGVSDIKKVYYAEWSETEGFFGISRKNNLLLEIIKVMFFVTSMKDSLLEKIIHFGLYLVMKDSLKKLYFYSVK